MKDTVSEGMMTVIVIALAALVLGGGKLLWDNVLYPKITGEINEIDKDEDAYIQIIDNVRL